MEEVYRTIGKIYFWVCFSTGTVIIFLFTIIVLFNLLGRKFKTLWIVVEFVYYRKDFKEFVKDKKRHPKLKSN